MVFCGKTVKISSQALFLVFCLSFLNATESHGWMSRYNGPADSWDRAYALTLDAAGNVYVTGASESVETFVDYATIKYGSFGRRLWVARYNGSADYADKAYSIAVDGYGNAYITGESWGSETDQDYATVKYDENGEEVWVARYNGPGNGRDVANALVVDELGNVYVTGFSYGTGTLGDYTTIKYDTDGNELWVSRYDGPSSGLDVPKAIAIDGVGNVYVTGESVDYNDSYTTIKYDSEGNELWVARYSATTYFNDVARAITVDGEGNAYVTGFSYDTGTEHDYATIKYDGDGNELWVERYNGTGNSWDSAHSIAVDGAGNVYVTGQSSGIDTGYDYATVKYDADGNELWTARYDGPAGDDDMAKSITLDGEGNVYVTGKSHGIGTDWDFATIKYDSDGNEEWIWRFNYLGDSDDRAKAIAIDHDGNICVTGRSRESGESFDYTTLKYFLYTPYNAAVSE
ncbi:MAG: SBBP repeat-containing protein [Candidatus Glassbacteria bacterium]